MNQKGLSGGLIDEGVYIQGTYNWNKKALQSKL